MANDRELLINPLGLGFLASTDHFLIHQELDLLELATGAEMENKYKILDKEGAKVFSAVEQSEFMSRQCCCHNRAFQIKVMDSSQNEVIHFSRECGCNCCCCPCCLHKLDVYTPPGTYVGSVVQNWSLLFPSFTIKNSREESVLHVKGPFCTCKCGNNVKFHMYDDNWGEVGSIVKVWGGAMRELYTDSDEFSLNFPASLDVPTKAMIMGAAFLIDFMYYESPPPQRR